MQISEHNMLTVSPEVAHGLNVGVSGMWYDTSLATNKDRTERLWGLIARFGKITSLANRTTSSALTIPLEEGDYEIIILAADCYVKGILDLGLVTASPYLTEDNSAAEQLFSFLVDHELEQGHFD